jgi:predicted ester cyclase
MSKTNVQIVQEYVQDVLNHKQFERIFDYFTEDCIFHSSPYVGLGISMDDRSGDKVILVDIAPNSPAAGNLRPGDEIVRVSDGTKTWEGFKDLKSGMWGQGIMGTPITVTVNRDGKPMDIPLKRGRVEAFDMVLSTYIDQWRDNTLKFWPDLNIEIKMIFGEGDRIAFYLTDSGTNQEYHRSAVWGEVGIFRLKNGKIVESWGVEDSFSQLKQLGFQINEPVAEPAF